MASQRTLFARGVEDPADHDDIWDDSALIEAYDRALATTRAELGMTAAGGDTRSVQKRTARWQEGGFCSAVYDADGQTYEATIVSIEGKYATIEFIGYKNRQKTLLSELELSGGKKTRKLQQRIADVIDAEYSESGDEYVDDDNEYVDDDDEGSDGEDVRAVGSADGRGGAVRCEASQGQVNSSTGHAMNYTQGGQAKVNGQGQAKVNAQGQAKVNTQGQAMANGQEQAATNGQRQATTNRYVARDWAQPCPPVGAYRPPQGPWVLHPPQQSGPPPGGVPLLYGPPAGLHVPFLSSGPPSHAPFVPPPPPPPPIGPQSTEEMANMLVSWYTSGYYTGYYQAKQETCQGQDQRR